MTLNIKQITPQERPWVLEVVRGWGADFIVTRGRKVYAADLPGFYAVDDDDKKLGLVTYEILGDQCEVITLDAFEKYRGIGTALLDKVVNAARRAGCKRLWLITTNDNLEALRFYQKRGMTIAAVHINAIARSRELKPSISEIGKFGIPIRDEIEFEMCL
ncbi:MAG: GNAT family N-acetyltransferase [Candidatus Zixiibacteriota bacterium]